jgi:outer membrane biosynthesis protein TonB
MKITSKDYRKLTVWRFLLILNLLIAPLCAIAQTNAEDYFHGGAQNYIFGDKKKAATEIYTGLKMYPTDEKLNAVAKLLQKKDPEDQNQSKKNQQNQDQKKDQDKQQQQQQQKQNQKSEQQKKDEEKARQEQAKKEQEQKEQQAGQKDNQDDKDKQSSATELRMSPEEARKLLDELKDDAKVLLFSPTNQPINTQPGKFKDW